LATPVSNDVGVTFLCTITGWSFSFLHALESLPDPGLSFPTGITSLTVSSYPTAHPQAQISGQKIGLPSLPEYEEYLCLVCARILTSPFSPFPFAFPLPPAFYLLPDASRSWQSHPFFFSGNPQCERCSCFLPAPPISV